MNVFDIEKYRIKFSAELRQCPSPRQKLFLLQNYFDKVLSEINYYFAVSYVIEFVDEFVYCLNHYTPQFQHPRLAENILLLLNKLKNIPELTEYSKEFNTFIQEITFKRNQLKLVLEGKQDLTTISQKLFFPVLEENHILISPTSFGLLDSLTIKISKSLETDNFLIIPSSEIIERRINNQIRTSWIVAASYVNKFTHISGKFHDVIIQFDKRLGDYIGDSLGIALTIGFIEQLVKLYNAPVSLSLPGNMATTGSMDKNGAISSLSESIINTKVDIVFFSNINTFIVPDADRATAEKRLQYLKTEFPQRDLKIIPIADLEDLMNRRNIVDLKKKNSVRLLSQTLKGRRTNIVLLFILLMVTLFFLLKDIDDNPAFFENQQKVLFVKNKEGKTLWSKGTGSYLQTNSEGALRHFQKFLDINKDGANEVLLCTKDDNSLFSNNGNNLYCYDKTGHRLWEYIFGDKVKTLSKMEDFNFYNVFLIDTVQIVKRTELILFANNCSSFPGAIFRVDALSGKRLSGTFWHSGNIASTIIGDFDNDGLKELAAVAYDTGFNDVVFFIIKLKQLNGTSPSSPDYVIPDKNIAQFVAYVRIPQTDYSKYLREYTNHLEFGSLNYDSETARFSFIVNEGTERDNTTINYMVDKNLKDFHPLFSNDFRFKRNLLIYQGAIKAPLTDSPEYSKRLLDQILFWNGSSFINKKQIQ
ncbi:MAG: hypothetical protein ACM3RX_07380 [Methanococcaceae archaeon]